MIDFSIPSDRIEAFLDDLRDSLESKKIRAIELIPNPTPCYLGACSGAMRVYDLLLIGLNNDNSNLFFAGVKKDGRKHDFQIIDTRYKEDIESAAFSHRKNI